jgi:hypothetical protein
LDMNSEKSTERFTDSVHCPPGNPEIIMKALALR